MSSTSNGSENKKPVIFLAFSNPPAGARGYLRNLGEEARQLETVLQQAEQSNLCEVVIKPYAGLSDILEVFREYRNRIAIFHYAGHAKNFMLLLEDASTNTGKGANRGTALIDGRGLATFLGEQNGLQFVFLNACSTQPQVEALLAANVSAVVATSQSIRDDIATKLASEFYASLSSGANLQKAFNEAEGVAQAMVGMGNTRDITFDDDDDDGAEELHWPWNLAVKPGAELVMTWSLPDAANEPLFGLPTLPQHDLPEQPFRHLNFFTEQDAELFFGRGHEIRSLYELVSTPKSAPIILFYGEAGVGKSSLLAAGLLPRLQGYTIHYIRRDRDIDMIQSLAQVLWMDDCVPDNLDDEIIAQRWHEVEQQHDQPLIIILDQIDELFTRPNPDHSDELNDFLDVLTPLFVQSNERPQGKLVFSFRKEWLADVEDAMKVHLLPRTKLFLSRLHREGIIDAVEGVAHSERLQTHYGLSIELALAEVIADDLLEDPDSPVAPTLQILLTKMWTQALIKNADHPYFDIHLYQSLKREGLLLDDFLNQQLGALHEWHTEMVDSGFVLDFLAAHTTPQGMVNYRTQTELLAMYHHRQEEIPALVQKCEDLYLLFNPNQQRADQPKATQLAHDALAGLTRALYEESDRSGQRARRILDSRVVEWRDDQGQPIEGTPLDETDLTLVEAGLGGTRDLTPLETRLVAASHVARQQRERERKWRLRILAGLMTLVVIGAVVALIQWQAAVVATKASISRELASQSKAHLEQSNYELALLLAVEATNSASTFEADTALQKIVAHQGRVLGILDGHTARVNGAVWNADESRVLTWSSDHTVNLWDGKRGRLIKELKRHRAPVTGAAWNRLENRILTWGKDGTARLWDADGTYLATLGGHTRPVLHALWRADDSQILTWGAGGLIQAWDGIDGSYLYTFHSQDPPAGISWSTTQKQFLTWDETGQAQLWNSANEGATALATLNGHTNKLIGALWNHDESRILTWSWDDTALLWDSKTGEFVTSLKPHTRQVSSGHYNQLWGSKTKGVIERPKPPIRQVSSGQDNQLWGSETREVVASLKPPTRQVSSGHDSQTKHTRKRYHILIKGATWNQDNTQILTWGWDGTARIWDGHTGNELKTFQGHTDTVNGASWNADESKILTWSWDGTLRTWDAHTNHPPENRSTVENIANNHANNKDIVVTNEIAVFRGHTNVIAGAKWSDDDAYILSWSWDHTARVWDSYNHDEPVILSGHTNWILGATWSKHEDYILTWSWDHNVRVWDWRERGEIALIKGEPRTINTVMWDPQRNYILTWHMGHSPHPPELWQATDGKKIASLEGHTTQVKGAIFSVDGQRILTWAGNTAHMWRSDNGQQVAVLDGHQNAISGAAWSNNGKRIVTWSHDKTTRLWNGDNGHRSGTLADSGHAIEGAAWNHDGSRLFAWSRKHTGHLWDGSTRQIIATIDNPETVIGAAWNHEGQYLTWGRKNKAHLWNGEDGQHMYALTGHEGTIEGARWNRNESRILTWSSDETARLWNAANGREVAVLTGHEDDVEGAMWNPDESRILTWSLDSTARLWNGSTGRPRKTLLGHTMPIWGGDWRADGSQLLTWSSDGTVRTWDGKTGEKLVALTTHADAVKEATWTEDGKVLLTRDDKGTVRFHFESTERLRDAACDFAPRNMTQTEWAQYMPNQAYRATCEELPVGIDTIP
ncbi:MAG: CHAT domain-containing protein [Chloroflexota bacterium]